MNLNQHIKAVHFECRLFVCRFAECGKKFQYRLVRDNHEKTGSHVYIQVVRAKKKDTGNVYALKIMDKKFITKENKTSYVKLERVVLDQLDHPGIVRLFFTFQDSCSLYAYVGHQDHAAPPGAGVAA